MAATTLNFKNKDVCSWKLSASETEFYFSQKFNITFEDLTDIDCKVVWGPTLDKMTNEVDCAQFIKKSLTSIMAFNHVHIIAVGKTDQAYLQFSYNSVNFISTYNLTLAVCTSVFLVSCFVACFILVILQKASNVKLDKAENKVKNSAVIMSIQMAKARAAFNEMQRREGKPLTQDPYVKKNAAY